MTTAEMIDALREGRVDNLIVANEIADEIIRLKQENEAAKETIRKMLTSEYGDTCQFCAWDQEPDAKCANVGGSGGWCCENARWRGVCCE